MNTRDLSDTEKETLATLIKMNIVTMGSGCVDIGISECTDINQFIDAQKNSGNVRVICGKDNKPWRICSENSVGEWRSDSVKTIIHVDNCLDGHPNDVAQDNATTSVSEDERKKMQRHFHNYTEMVNQLSKKELFFQDIRFNFHTTEFWLKKNNQEEELQVLFNIIMLSNYLIEAKQDLVLYQQKNNKKDYYIRQK